ncbi:MAG: SDR family NAD(P)-dependent oxidoreductase, partial [Gemmataceae bacterium]
MRLQNKVAVVTGGARGIGRAICERYASEGARVVVADVAEDVAKGLASELGRGAFAVVLDVTRQESIDAMVASAVRQAGRIDILVNNAGVFDLAPLLDITRDSYRKVFAVNVEGLLFTLQAVA